MVKDFVNEKNDQFTTVSIQLMERFLSAIEQLDYDIRTDPTIAGMRAALEAGTEDFRRSDWAQAQRRSGQSLIEPDPEPEKR